jgi:hypothetical protein
MSALCMAWRSLKITQGPASGHAGAWQHEAMSVADALVQGLLPFWFPCIQQKTCSSAHAAAHQAMLGLMSPTHTPSTHSSASSLLPHLADPGEVGERGEVRVRHGPRMRPLRRHQQPRLVELCHQLCLHLWVLADQVPVQACRGTHASCP